MAVGAVSLARPRARVDLGAGLRAAATGRPLGRVLRDMAATVFGPGRLTPEECS